MSHNKTVQSTIKFIGYLGAVVFVAVIYNNCGYSPFTVESANVPVHKLQDDMVVAMAGLLPTAACAQSDRYICSHKIFSQTATANQRVIDYACLKQNDGVELCVHGNEFTFNSSVAAQLCKENCNESYDYEEFNCYYELSNNKGSYPLQATASNLNEALSETYNLCLRVANAK